MAREIKMKLLFKRDFSSLEITIDKNEYENIVAKYSGYGFTLIEVLDQ